MKKSVRILLTAVYIALVPLAFFVGLGVVGKRLEERTLESLAATMASHNTNVTFRAIPDGPWVELQKDRVAHPRKTSEDREARINGMLRELVQDKPQHPAGG